MRGNDMWVRPVYNVLVYAAPSVRVAITEQLPYSLSVQTCSFPSKPLTPPPTLSLACCSTFPSDNMVRTTHPVHHSGTLSQLSVPQTSFSHVRTISSYFSSSIPPLHNLCLLQYSQYPFQNSHALNHFSLYQWILLNFDNWCRHVLTFWQIWLWASFSLRKFWMRENFPTFLTSIWKFHQNWNFPSILPLKVRKRLTFALENSPENRNKFWFSGIFWFKFGILPRKSESAQICPGFSNFFSVLTFRIFWFSGVLTLGGLIVI